jgi:hypothetical protein
LIVVEKSVLMKVVLPRPDSPATYDRTAASDTTQHLTGVGKQTIIVKAAPLFATILCRWLGRLAMPIGEALSAAAGAIVGGYKSKCDAQSR